MHTLFLDEHRCSCGKLLLKGAFFDGALEIKCDRCGKLNNIGSIKLPKDVKHYLLVVDRDGLIVNASTSASHILGYTLDELIGKRVTLIDPTVTKEIGQTFFGPDSTLDDDNYFILDREHRLKNGRMIPVTVFFKRYRPNEKENYLLASVKLMDTFTDGKKFGIYETRPLDGLSDFYFDIDPNGNYLYTNPSMGKLFGCCPEKLLGKNYFDTIVPDTRTESKKIFKHFSADEKSYSIIDYVCPDPKEGAIHRDLYFTPNYNGMGKFTGYRVFGWIKP